jgi:hypothetical protein
MMSIPRPIKADLDSWASQGNPDWTWDKVLPVLKRIESDQDSPTAPCTGARDLSALSANICSTPAGKQEQALLGLPAFGLPALRSKRS